jgi:hypothetical protein
MEPNPFIPWNFQDKLPCYPMEGMLESRLVVIVGARLMAGRLTLDQLVGVQISSPQPT